MNSLQRSTTPESQPCGLPVARASNSTSLGESWATLTHLLAKTEDRKSTRLNSSHGYISYAVFCLKKKNTLLNHLWSPSDKCAQSRSHLHAIVTTVQEAETSFLLPGQPSSVNEVLHLSQVILQQTE